LAAHESAESILSAAGRGDDHSIDLAGTALGFALYDRPDLNLAPYRQHLATLADDLAHETRRRRPSAIGRAAALASVLAVRHGYRGDRATYDDLHNADLARVIDRKRGLPVALSILWMHAGRAQNWTMTGLNLPGHFLIRLRGADGEVTLDPFNGGDAVSDDDIRRYIEHTLGADMALAPQHLETVGDRAILMRLRNNIKLRLPHRGQLNEALRIVDSMRLVSPHSAALWRETASIHTELGNINAAVASLEQAVPLAGPGDRVLIRQELLALRSKLN
jgi:regulator of sirC expression with transglutaminase-like and TPR domain